MLTFIWYKYKKMTAILKKINDTTWLHKVNFHFLLCSSFIWQLAHPTYDWLTLQLLVVHVLLNQREIMSTETKIGCLWEEHVNFIFLMYGLKHLAEFNIRESYCLDGMANQNQIWLCFWKCMAIRQRCAIHTLVQWPSRGSGHGHAPRKVFKVNTLRLNLRPLITEF